MSFDYLAPDVVLKGVILAYLFCLIGLAVLSAVHRRNLTAIPIRIHVGGSRGKTSTARYIGAALREAGLRVMVKTTGTLPTLIDPEGREHPWKRRGAPTISETVAFMRRAVQAKADAVVLESMAIDPEYLWASERYLVRATHVAITNVRPDHAEVLGEDKDAMAHAVSLLVPQKGKLFLTTEADHPAIRSAAERRDTAIEFCDVSRDSPDQGNRKLAAAVSKDLVDAPEAVSRGLEKAGSDPGGFFIADTTVSGRPLRFFGAFACNDVASLKQLWTENTPDAEAGILLNARADRPERTREFLDFVGGLVPSPTLFMTGRWRDKWIQAAGLDAARVHRLRARRPQDILEEVAPLTPGLLWGIGNYAGIGHILSQYLRQSVVNADSHP